MRGAELSSDHYLVEMVTKQFQRELRNRSEGQNTLKWNVKKIGEMKWRKDLERKIAQKFMASRQLQGKGQWWRWLARCAE